MSRVNGEIVIVEIPMDEGDPLGATPDAHLVIIQVQKETLADGRLQVGDKIVSVNDREPKDAPHFFHLLNASAREQNKAVLRVRRDSSRATELNAHNMIPAERARFIQRREGFLYKMVSVAYQRGIKLGLCIKQRQNHVLVSRINPGTLSARVFQVLDQILDIDGQPVTDSTVTETAIRDGFRRRQFFTAVIARPTSAEARKQVEEELSRPTQQLEPQNDEEPSVRMAADVRDIALREIARITAKQLREKPSIVATPGAPKHPKRPTIVEKPMEKMIASDLQDEKGLKHIGLIHSVSKK
jgi:hypothetical protein